MGLAPNKDVFITCALTGAGDSTGRSHKVPVTPREIADSAIEAANVGAAIIHIHVRDPETGKPSRDLSLYQETVGYIRESGVDMVLNLTSGMGADLVLGGPETPMPPDPAETDMVGATERLVHVANILPEVCTLDCGTMNFGAGDHIMTNTPKMLMAMAGQIKDLGVRPEIEVFDLGHLVLAKWLKEQGFIEDPVMIQLCMGIPWGAPDDIASVQAMVASIPQGWTYSGFSIGRNQMPFAALSVLAGGNIRVGLEDNLWLSKGRLATNGELVERAVIIAEGMGSNIIGPDAVRERLNLTKRWG